MAPSIVLVVCFEELVRACIRNFEERWGDKRIP